METLFPFVISSSMMDDMVCKRKWFNRYCLRLKSPAKSIHLRAGSDLASALEITRKAFFNLGLDSQEAIDLGVNYLDNVEDLNDPCKNNVNLIFAFQRYFQKFPLEVANKPCELINGDFAIEYKFEFDLFPHPEIENTNVVLAGKLDFVGERKAYTGETLYYVHDDKTTKYVCRLPGSRQIDIARELEQYETRGQFIAYNYAARRLGIDTCGTIVHRIPLLAEPEPAFELEVPCSEWTINAWYNSFMSEIHDLLERYKDYKKGKLLDICFPSSYNMACKSYNETCIYKLGCQHKEGIEKLKIDLDQIVSYPESDVSMTLENYLERYSK